MIVGTRYLERGRPVEVLARWLSRPRPGPFPLAFGAPARGTPRNVLIRREDSKRVVRSFRGLRRPAT